MGACSLREQDQVRTPHLASSCHSRSTKPCHWLWPAPRRTTISHKRDISVCSVNRTALGSRRAAALAALCVRSAHLKTLRASRCNFGASEASLLLAALDSGAELEQIDLI